MSQQNTTNNQYRKQTRLIKQLKLYEHNATVADEDKGTTTVIIYKQTLNEKVNQFIKDNQIDTLKITRHKKCKGKFETP
jgi:hypothetical protein